MTNNPMRRLAGVIRSTSKKSFTVLNKVTGAHFTLGLLAVALFVLAYAVETKAILVLESSQDLFGTIH
jgi:hypothetical protein